MKRQKGFTLIELLVVIAIIALLMSIMMPTLSMVKKFARDTMCMARLNQWGLVFAIYLDDHDDTFPTNAHFTENQDLMKLVKYRKRRADAGPNPGSSYFAYNDDGQDYSYSREGGYYSEMAYCPSAKKTIESGGSHPYAVWKYANSSYGLNLWVGCPGGGGRGDRRDYCWGRDGNISAIKSREEIPMFMDCFYDPYPDDCDPTVYHYDKPPDFDGQMPYGGTEMWRVCMNRHNGGINCTFLDLSARKVGLKELWEIKWSRRWFTDPDGNPDYSPPAWPQWMRKFRDYR